MELSEEMKEAIRILREDGQIGAFNKMTESHQAVIERLDHIENGYSEYRAEREKTPTTGPPNDPTNPVTDVPPVTEIPQPPPVLTEDDKPKEKVKKNWWDRYPQ